MANFNGTFLHELSLIVDIRGDGACNAEGCVTGCGIPSDRAGFDFNDLGASCHQWLQINNP